MSKIISLYNNSSERDKEIVRLLLFGVVMNTILAISKIIVGESINSIALSIDGVNGLADILSFALAVIMVFLSNKASDDKHPLGYGRIEYLSSFLITLLIAYLGFRSIYLSVKELLMNEGAPDYNIYALVIIIVSFVYKYIWGATALKVGKKHSSNTMLAFGTDTRQDSFNSIGLLVAMIVERLFHFDLEPLFSIIIAIGTLKVAIVMLKKEMDQLLGSTADPEFVKKIKQMIIEEKGVENVFNLVIHDYGENNTVGSLNIVVEEDMSAKDISILSNRIIHKAKEQGLTLTSVGICATDSDDPMESKMWDSILRIIEKQGKVDRAYAFLYDEEYHTINFHILINSKYNHNEVVTELKKEINKLYPDVKVYITLCSAE